MTRGLEKDKELNKLAQGVTKSNLLIRSIRDRLEAPQGPEGQDLGAQEAEGRGDF